MASDCDGCGAPATTSCPYCETYSCDDDACKPICEHDVRKPKQARVVSRVACEDCPPVGYPTDDTRCLPCPRRAQPRSSPNSEG